MEKNDFIAAMCDLWGDDIQEDTLEDAYVTYESLLECGDNERARLEEMPSMDTRERLLWRTALSEMGHELTPLQVDQYISIVEMVLE